MLSCSATIVAETLAHIHAGATRDAETAVLWLGRTEHQVVMEVFRPQQIVARDFFNIPAKGMRGLLAHLREKRLHILAQAHSHPESAFHSLTDNEWAVIRHVGAVSLVVPWFGFRTSAVSFLDDIAAFQLDGDDVWQEVPPRSVLAVLP